MPKASWKELMESKEAAKPVIVESDDSEDTDLDGIPDQFQDADEDSDFMIEDDMTDEFP